MKTKFIKVPISEFPKEEKAYFCLIANGQGLITCHNKMFHQYAGITHYLVEVEDREDEMRDMLEKIIYAQFTSGVPLSSLNAEISNARDYLKTIEK